MTKRKIIAQMVAFSALFALTTACSDQVSFDTAEIIKQGEGGLTNSPGVGLSRTHDYSETLKQEVELRKVDILMVIDNSGSMAEEQLLIGSQLGSFLSHISEADWQLGVVTTDVLAGDGLPGFSGELDFIPGMGDRRVLRPDDPGKEMLFLDLITRSDDCGVAVGDLSCSSNSEQPLQALMQVINKRERANQGFFREGAELIVVMISDEDEMSIGGDDATKPDQVLNHFKFTFPNKKLTTYGVIIEPGDSECYDQNSFFSVAAYGTHVNELVQKTQGLTFSLCSNNYGMELEALSRHMKKRLLFDSIDLKFNPVPDSIQVELLPEGEDVSWRLEGKRTIVFDSKPPEGTEVRVKYLYETFEL